MKKAGTDGNKLRDAIEALQDLKVSPRPIPSRPTIGLARPRIPIDRPDHQRRSAQDQRVRGQMPALLEVANLSGMVRRQRSSPLRRLLR